MRSSRPSRPCWRRPREPPAPAVSPLAPVEALLAAAAPLVDVTPLRTAWEARQDPPVHLLVVGRRSVGRSSLLNAWAGRRVADTGLGGVTTEPLTVEGPGVVLTELPGLEDVRDAARLARHVDRADAVVWVVDGLQPGTGVERAVLEAAVPRGMALHVVVSRLDLVDPEEHDPILERIRRLAAPWEPRSVRGEDPRRAAVGLVARVWPERSPRRRAALATGVEAVAAALAHLQPPEDPEVVAEEAAGIWRSRVDVAWREAAREAREGGALFRDEAAGALVRRLQDAAADLARPVRARLGTAPGWSPPEPGSLDLGGQVRDLVSGTAGVVRDLRVRAAALAAEGEAAWRSWARGADTAWLRSRRAAVLEARAAVAGARQAVEPLEAPGAPD